MSRHQTYNNNERTEIDGFTIIEVMVAIAILVVIVGIATPSFTTFIKNSRIEQESQQLYAILNQARQLAITSGRRVFLCRSSDLTTPTCNTTTADGKWHYAKLIYTPPTGTTIPTATTNYQNYTYQAISSGMNATEKQQMINGVIEAPTTDITIQSNNDHFVVIFNSQGFLENDNAPLLFSVCDSRNNPESYGKHISVSLSGRIKLHSTGTTTGEIKCDATQAT